MKRLLFSAFFATSLLGGVCLQAQQIPNPNYTLRVTDASGPAGSVQTVQVLLDNNSADDVVGFTFGVCWDPAVATAIDARLGQAVLTAIGGQTPFVSQPSIIGNGVLAGVVLSNGGPAGPPGSGSIPPGTSLELIEIDFSLTGTSGSSTPLEFCTQFGGIITDISIFPEGTALAELPNTVDGNLTVGIVGPTFGYSLPDVTVGFDSASGTGDFNISATITENPASPGFPNDTFGFSMAINHDPAVLNPTTIDPTATLAGLNSGNGPDFFGASIEPDGISVGVVYSTTSATEILLFDVAQDVIAVNYETNAGNLQGSFTPISTDLSWASSLGTPAVMNLVGISLAGDTVPAGKNDAVVTLLPGGPFLRRGDCNNDGGYNLGDALAILGAVFGSTAPPPCDDACDGNDDGSVNVSDAVYVLQNLFAGSDDPPPPFPGCGADPTPDSVGCTSFACP